MDADILQAIRIIDEKIASLQEARDRLAAAFGVNGNLSTAIHGKANVAAHLDQPTNGRATVQPATRGVSHGGRKVQLAQLLMERGSMSRITIIASCGIPEGTVSYCLNDKRFFEQNEKGDWDITEFSRKGLLQRAKTGVFEWGASDAVKD
jgi:hypothetical protein